METRPNLQSVITRYPNSGDLSPLAANETFRRAIDAELGSLQDAADRSQALAARNENLTGVVTMFSNAVTALRSIATRFPEAAVPINEAVKQTQLAMGLVRDNPTPAAAAAPGAPGAFHFGDRAQTPAAPSAFNFGGGPARPVPSPVPAPVPARAPLSNIDEAARRAEANRR